MIQQLCKFITVTLLFVLVDWSKPVAGQEMEKQGGPLKIFLLVGQSNMQGHAKIHTLEYLKTNPQTAVAWQKLCDEDGTPKTHNKIWINYLSSNGVKKGQLTAGFGANEEKIGPELSFGVRMQEQLGEPIFIIKVAWGGKSLHTDFRPPSAGPFEFYEQQLRRIKKQDKDVDKIHREKQKATGKHYALMMDHIKTVLTDVKSSYTAYDEKSGFELAGFVWFQGWNDMVDGGVYPNRNNAGGYDLYSQLLTHFIRDVRNELNAPNLPMVIGVMGVGGPTDKYSQDQKRYLSTHQNFRNAMAAPASLPEFKDNVTAVLTETYWDAELAGLRKREAKVDAHLKELRKKGELGRDESSAMRKKLRAKEFSDEELHSLQTGISNLEYHYLGSAKIMVDIGNGFADAMLKLQRK